jgi:glyoxylase-like metal-dependent hydrolase (beta-lactamase superfamily II)
MRYFLMPFVLLITFVLSLDTKFSTSQALAQDDGFFKITISGHKVTALSDAKSRMGFDLLRDVSPSDVKAAAKEAGIDEDSFPAWVNVFLIEHPDGLVLIDTGLGPDADAQMLKNLKAAGFDPANVKAVLLTHYHGDHIGGLLDANGQPTFPDATIYASKAEDKYWLGGGGGDGQQAKKVLAPYLAVGKYKLFSPGDEVLPGVKVVELYGHTPGHVGFLFEGGDEDLLFWGDIVHIRLVQFKFPGATLRYDVDTAKAAETRKRVYSEYVGQGHVVAGAHLPFPGLGRIVASGQAYDYIPVEKSTTP